jgi:hypothetical protein
LIFLPILLTEILTGIHDEIELYQVVWPLPSNGDFFLEVGGKKKTKINYFDYFEQGWDISLKLTSFNILSGNARVGQM